MTTVSTIRDAASVDRVALGDLHRRSSWVWVEDRPFLEGHPDVLGVAPGPIAEGRVRVAVGSAGEPLGFSVVIDREDVCELEDLSVDPEAMRRGVARRSSRTPRSARRRGAVAGCASSPTPARSPSTRASASSRANPRRCHSGRR